MVALSSRRSGTLSRSTEKRVKTWRSILLRKLQWKVRQTTPTSLSRDLEQTIQSNISSETAKFVSSSRKKRTTTASSLITLQRLPSDVRGSRGWQSRRETRSWKLLVSVGRVWGSAREIMIARERDCVGARIVTNISGCVRSIWRTTSSSYRTCLFDIVLPSFMLICCSTILVSDINKIRHSSVSSRVWNQIFARPYSPISFSVVKK